jgi:hypothetical protein
VKRAEKGGAFSKTQGIKPKARPEKKQLVLKKTNQMGGA